MPVVSIAATIIITIQTVTLRIGNTEQSCFFSGVANVVETGKNEKQTGGKKKIKASDGSWCLTRNPSAMS